MNLVGWDAPLNSEQIMLIRGHCEDWGGGGELAGSLANRFCLDPLQRPLMSFLARRGSASTDTALCGAETYPPVA